jgi:alkanesulfonate monooxygenase SsuD/methylene tetrahydromethanopterin reductase-like flavin-dependent oxidoreductase (luciferase family)
MLAIIGGLPRQFTPFFDLYRKSAHENGIAAEDLQVGVNNHMYVGEDAEKVASEFFPHYAKMMDRVGRSRGWQPMSRPQFDFMRAPEGSLLVGSVEQVVEKILYQHQLFGFTRFVAQSSLGTLPHELTMKSIEIFASQVVPEVKRRLGVG